MSQIGVIISCGSPAGMLDWVVDFSYQLDAGGRMGLSRIIVSNNPNSPYLIGLVTAEMWTSPTSTITVSPNPPGTTNTVLLPCPPLVQNAAFGLALK